MSKPRFTALAAFGLIVSLSASVPAWGQLNGVLVDPQGVLQLRVYQDPGGRLMEARKRAARAALDHDVARPSKLRMVSITRLERELRDRLADDRQPTEEMLNLAGLTRVSFVFFFPETNDIVLAGPAEGWCQDLAGRTVGIATGRPILELQDMIVALRAYGPSAGADPIVSVSIDPTQEGLARMQNFLASLRGVRPSDGPRIADGLRTSMGQQDVVVRGVSPKTHFAQVLVEADYRMKLIGIGLEPPPIKMDTFISRAGRSSAASLQRWYFVPEYECVRVSDDNLSMEMVGNGVKLLTEDQVVAADGTRRVSGRSDRASTLYAQSFTRLYPKLAEQSAIWAQMRNCIDLAVAAAFVREQGYFDRAGWDLGVFGDETAYAVETLEAPTHVDTVANAVWKRGLLMTPVGGGVRIQATQALRPGNMHEDNKHEVNKARAEIDPKQIAADRWWWD